jgi:heme-degrading monooxygenase HmoA
LPPAHGAAQDTSHVLADCIAGQTLHNGLMMVRTWSARATPAGADSYHAYFEKTLLPELRGISGFSGGLLLSRDVNGLVELTTHTMWESMDAIAAFAGDDLTAAVVEPEALACLHDSDPTVVHRTVLVDG